MAHKTKADIEKGVELNRRDFLKNAGLLVGGVVAGSAGLAAGCSRGTETETEIKTTTVTSPPATQVVTTTVTAPSATFPLAPILPASKGYILADSAKCAGCEICMITCSLVHEGAVNPSLARIKV
jgi:hypothetical protein